MEAICLLKMDGKVSRVVREVVLRLQVFSRKRFPEIPQMLHQGSKNGSTQAAPTAFSTYHGGRKKLQLEASDISTSTLV